MTSEDVKYYRELLEPRFVAIGGRVFVNGTVDSLRRAYRGRKPMTVDENTSNHVHFEFYSGRSESGVRSNYALAEGVRVVWRECLRRKFPRRLFRLFVSNEYQCWPTSRKPIRVKEERVDTVLRLWSLPADHAGFDKTYHPDAAGPDYVMWPEYRRGRPVKLSTVIGLIQTKALHRAKERTLRERWHAI